MKPTRFLFLTARRGCSSVAVLFLSGAAVWATPALQQRPTARALSHNTLDRLVAPIALYSDSLLAQALAASTHPLELVELQQWLQQNSHAIGPLLTNAARQQNWDPSVQALVEYPGTLATLNHDIRGTQELGIAFLAQQDEVMAAVQRTRLRAHQNGRQAQIPIVDILIHVGQDPPDSDPPDSSLQIRAKFHDQPSKHATAHHQPDGKSACPWRIHKITRQSVSGTTRDSASATDTRQSLSATQVRQNLGGGRLTPRVSDAH